MIKSGVKLYCNHSMGNWNPNNAKRKKQLRKNRNVTKNGPGRKDKKTRPNSDKGGRERLEMKDVQKASPATRRRRAIEILDFVYPDLDLLKLAVQIGKQ